MGVGVGQTRRHDTATQDICSVDAKNSRKRQPVYAEKLHLGMKYTRTIAVDVQRTRVLQNQRASSSKEVVRDS